MSSNKLPNGSGNFNVGSGVNGNCTDAFILLPAPSVENAHDLGNRDQYAAPLNNNANR